MILAAQNGHAAAVRAMCSAGADTEIANNSGENALSIATKNGHLECMRILLEFDASVNGGGSAFSPALGWACEKGHLAAIELLLMHGASPTARATDGRTAFKRCHAGALDAACIAKVEELLRKYQ